MVKRKHGHHWSEAPIAIAMHESVARFHGGMRLRVDLSGGEFFDIRWHPRESVGIDATQAGSQQDANCFVQTNRRQVFKPGIRVRSI